MSKYETFRLACPLERRQHRLEEALGHPLILADAAYQTCFHGGCLAHDHEQPAADGELLLEGGLGDGQGARDRDDVVRSGVAPAATGIAGLEGDVADAVLVQAPRGALGQIGMNLDAGDVPAESGEQGGDEAASGMQVSAKASSA